MPAVLPAPAYLPARSLSTEYRKHAYIPLKYVHILVHCFLPVVPGSTAIYNVITAYPCMLHVCHVILSCCAQCAVTCQV